jgi:hypothetical protein
MEAVMVIHQRHKFRSQPSYGFIIVPSSTAIRKTLAGKSLFRLTNKGWLLANASMVIIIPHVTNTDAVDLVL